MRAFFVRAIGRAAVLGLLVLGIGLISSQAAAAAMQDIASPNGPLTNIWLGDDMRCQVQHAGEAAYQFFSPTSQAGSCGTFLSLDSSTPGTSPTLYGSFLGTAYSNPTQSGVGGDGTPGNPYTVTTTGDAVSSTAAATTDVHISQVDSYVACASRSDTGACVGNEYYRTDITLTNNSLINASGRLYHAADCYLQGSDSGYGYVDTSSNAVACSQQPNNNPPALIEEFAPVTSGAHYLETGFSANYAAVQAQTDLPDKCDCQTLQDNGMSINWDFSLLPGQSQTFSMYSNFSPQGIVAPSYSLAASGGRSFTGNAPATFDGTMATFTDSKPGTTASDYTATIDWGDKTGTSAGTVASDGNGGFTVSGSHTYNNSGSYTITVAISTKDGHASSTSVTDSATVNPSSSSPPPSRPTAITQPAGSTQSSQAQMTGTVNPGGLPTTIHWEYGLDSAYRGPGYTGTLYDQRTADAPAGSGFTDEPVSATVGNLQPNSVYHYRLVATNSQGTTFGQDRTFKTAADSPPSTPVVGQTGNFAPAGGTVFVLINGQFVKLTDVRQLPNGTVVDALNGSLTLTVASGQNIAAAKRRKTYTGTFGGAVFKVNQNRTGRNVGLTTLSIVEGAYKGAPSYAACRKKAPRALSSRVLQSLHSRASGRFRTRGRYAAGTVRGTRWTTVDRCDGTLISVQLHSVLVTDFVKHLSVLVRAGQSYFAAAHPVRAVKPPTPVRRPPFTG